PSGPARLASVDIRRNEHSPAATLKTLAYLDNVLARRAAQTVGADEALICNTAGEVACAAAANVFWVKDGRLFTPALACGVLAGIVRGKLIASAHALGVECAQVRAAETDLAQAEAVFLTNSLIGVREVSEWGGRRFAPSSLAAELAGRI
ncbi:MAG TPA: aminotransferase class IV, partial [Phenylobacterium sp.]